MARPDFDRGAIDPETRMERMVLVLKPSTEQQRELDTLVEAEHTPGSPLYHQWLTPAEYGQRFGASAQDLEKMSAWLESHGFSVESIPAGRGAIVFTGNAAQVGEAFHTEIHRYNVGGAAHIGNHLDPQIPAALASVVHGVLSLHDFRRQSQIGSTRPIPQSNTREAGAAQPGYTTGGYHYLMPGDYGTIYDLNALYSAGTTGSGVSIAIVGRSDINLSDVSLFRSKSGLPANQPTVIHVGTDPGINDTYGDQDESTLDVEWAGATGYGATVKFVVGGSTATTDGIDLAAQYIVNNVVAPVMSTSYGLCEAYMGSSELAFYNNLWKQAASEGISSFVSAGDSGAAGCDSGSSSKGSVAGVNGLCSSPYSTCVGGTEFNEGRGMYWNGTNSSSNGSSALSYIPERVWNESALDGGSGLWAGGGGISGVYTQPTWQAGITGSSANGMRTVPDVSLTAASHDGYMIWENGNGYVIAGTSAASPAFAGIMSLVVQKQNGVWQGNANPALYSLLDAIQDPFHPTLSGNNSVSGVSGFTANGAAYNLATGLGSVDAELLANEWPASGTGAQPSLALNPSTPSITLFPGAKTTFTLSVAGMNGLSGTVALTASAPAGVTLSFSPSSLATGSSTTVTVTAASTASMGSGTVVITGKTGTHSKALNEAITIASPALTLTPSTSSATIFQGQSTTFSMTVGAATGYTAAVALTATAPAGVSITFNPSTVKPGATATATVAVAGSTASGTYRVPVKGASGAATTTANIEVTVVAPTLTITPSVSSVTTFRGQSTTFTVTAGASSGYTNAVALTATAPSGVSVTFNPAVVKPGSTATATATAAATATAGSGTISVKGSSASAAATATVRSTVVAPTLTITPSATSLSIFRGQSTMFTVTAGASSGYTNPIALTATAPGGVAVTFSPASVKAGSTVTATVAASTTATTGTGAIAITETSGAAVVHSSVNVTVNAPALAVMPSTSSVSLLRGQSTTLIVAVSASSGFTNPISLTATTLTGLTVGMSSSTLKAGSSLTLTIKALSTAPIGTGAIAVKATSGLATASSTVGVSVR